MNWHSLTEVSRHTRIPAPTARRYAALFRDFLPGKRQGRMTKYPDEALDIFRRINAWYNQGLLTHEIEERLLEDLPRTHEVDAVAVAAPVQAATTCLDVSLVRTVADLLDRFGKTLEILANQKMLIEHQRHDIQRLKSAFVLLAQNQKRLKGLPQSLIRPVALDQERRTQVLAQKDAELEEATRHLFDQNTEIQQKLGVLESEIVRLRRDRREMERYLLGKIRDTNS